MIGKKIKKIAKTLPLTARELAKEMNISTATLYGIYKRDDVEIKYLKRFSEISGIPISELSGVDFENPKQNDSFLEKQNVELKKENKTLRQELSDLKDKFIAFQMEVFQMRKEMQMGKHKASSKKTTLSKNEENKLMYLLNFER
jgi:transcriptional regulator with XRE-family HTH domain